MVSGRRRAGPLVYAALAALLVCSVAPISAASERSRLRRIQRFPMKGGLELAASGQYLYASQWNGHLGRAEHPKWGGVHILDVSRRKVKKVGFLSCPGYDNDVAVVNPDVIAIGYGQNTCARDPNTPGVLLADVSSPARPRVLSSIEVYFAHTISVHPTEPLLYASPGGWLPVGNEEGRVDIIDVSDVKDPKIVGGFSYPGYGCHDISFDIRPGRKLAFCMNASTTQLILDVSDPRQPEVIGRIVNPAIQYGHTALASPDGDLLAITDEAFVAHPCRTQANPVGALWIYDITDPTTPILTSYRSPEGGREAVGHLFGNMPTYCTAAMIDWIGGSRKLVASWYTGGTEVLDLSDPSTPVVEATYAPANSLAYGVDAYRGRIYVNDINRGIEVLELED